MTKISQRNRKTRYQTYEEKVAEVHETVVKPVLAKAWPKPKTDHLGILFGVPVFFLAFPFLFAVYFCVCAIINEAIKLTHFVIQQVVALL